MKDGATVEQVLGRTFFRAVWRVGIGVIAMISACACKGATAEDNALTDASLPSDAAVACAGAATARVAGQQNAGATCPANVQLAPAKWNDAVQVAVPGYKCAMGTHDPLRIYDDCYCTPVTEEQLQDAGVGQAICVAGIPGYSPGRWTLTCLSAADCPDQMTCVWGKGGAPLEPPPTGPGRCELSNLSGTSCGQRCDLRCAYFYEQDAGWAANAATLCMADCECGPMFCHDGLCDNAGQHRTGMCNWEGSTDIPCACIGGTCDSRHCCILPDGHVATGLEPECWALDGG